MDNKTTDMIMSAIKAITPEDYIRVLSDRSARTAASPVTLAFIERIAPPPQKIAAHYAAVAAARAQPKP